MATDKQIAANKANAQKSTGPKTPRGKSIASRNAIKHGFLAQTVLLPGESAERFLNLKNTYLQQFQPRTQAEFDLVDTLLVNRWRLMRNWTLESTSLIDQQPRRCHEAFTRHEVRLDRQYHRALDRLRQLQQDREKKETSKGTQIFEQNTALTDSEIPNRTIGITQTNHPENPIHAE